MSQYNVQKFNFTNSGGYVCYPKVMGNDRTWDSRSASNWSNWTLDIDQTKPVDLINDAGFSEGDIVFAGIDVVAGDDATCSKIFVVTKNGSSAAFNATGTTLDNSLNYEG